MGHWLSCGHREDNYNKQHNIQTKIYSKYCSKAIAYQTVCNSCKEEYEKNGLVLRTDKEAEDWLFNDKET